MKPLPAELRYLEGTDNRLLNMSVVIPVARSDWHLAVKLLKWIDCLRDSPELIVVCAPGVSEDEHEELMDCTTCTIVRTDFVDTGYFGGANQMFKAALDWMEKNRPGVAMFWVEADAIPMRSGWFAAILDEYRGCGQPFAGDVHLEGLYHATGNGCYHPDWRRIAPSLAALPGPDPEWGWDSQCSQDTFTRCHRMKTIQQHWRPPLPITDKWVKENIRDGVMLHHQCKDGSLIDVLCQRAGLPLIPLPEQLEKSTYSKGRQTPEDPALVKHLTPHQRMTVGLPMQSTSSGVPAIGILIVTCAKHIEYLRYCLKSVEKFARGFSDIVVAVEDGEAHHFTWIKKQRLHVYKPVRADKPMLSHQVVKCRADEILQNCNAVLYLDSDCMFWKPTAPADFVVNGKLRLLRERYADLRNPLRKNWQKCVERSLGFKPEYEGMVAHGITHWLDMLPALRTAVENHTEMDFDEHFTSGQDTFQQQVAEFDSMTAIAIRDFRHRYHCVDYDFLKDAKECGLPETADGQYIYKRERDNLVEFWGHAPLSRYKSDMDLILAGRVPSYYVK